MSLLSATQGRPERVRALFNLVHGCGGALPRADIAAWMAPTRRGQGPSPGDTKAALDATLQVASDLKLVSRSREQVEAIHGTPFSAGGFSDYVYHHLANLPLEDKDCVVLAAYAAAAVIAEVEDRLSLRWGKESADRIDSLLIKFMPRTDEEVQRNTKIFNSAKLGAWKNWLTCMGLAWPWGSEILLSPAERILRESSAFFTPRGTGAEVDAVEFSKWVAVRFPYLDGGCLFEKAADAAELPRSRPVSHLLTRALRELHDDEHIELRQYGDAGRSLALAPGMHEVKRFTHVVLKRGLA